MARICDEEGNHIEKELEEAKGIHNFDVCQLQTNLPASSAQVKAARLCTTHLVMVDGHAFAVAPATCFLPEKPDQLDTYLRKRENGWAFLGTVYISCGPKKQEVEITSISEKPTVFVHPDFDLTAKGFIQQHNFAVVRISKREYENAGDSIEWEFTRIAEPADGPNSDRSCRCYAWQDGASENLGEPAEYRVERCPLGNRAVAVARQHTCFRVKAKSTETELFDKLIDLADCEIKRCGAMQTMACFCGSSYDTLRKLHSVGFYYASRTAGELRFYSTPVDDNLNFIRNAAAGMGPQLGASESQLLEARKRLAGAVGQCFAEKHDPTAKDFIVDSFCGNARATKQSPALLEGVKASLAGIRTCMQTKKAAFMPHQPNSLEPFLLPPEAEMAGMAEDVLAEVLCPKSAGEKVIEAAKRIGRRVKQKAQCFDLAWRAHFSMGIVENRNDLKRLFDNKDMQFASVALSGVVPALAAALVGILCTENEYRVIRYPCKFIAYLLLSPTLAVDALLTGLIVTGDAAHGASKAIGPAVKAVYKNK